MPPTIPDPTPSDDVIDKQERVEYVVEGMLGTALAEAVAGVPVVRAFPFDFDTPNILTGAALYTPTVGDLLLDAWIEVVEEWNGTTPKGDVGTFDGTTTGWFQSAGGATALTGMTGEDMPLSGDGYVAGNTGTTLAVLSEPGTASFRVAPGKFTTVDPVKVVVSQDGLSGGANPGATQGSAILYLITCTPATA